MMLKVLLWGYATGVRSSRKIEERLQQDIVFMWLAGVERPDFRTLCLFRSDNKETNVFAGVIMIAQAMGMGSLGLVALDGSKVRANSGVDIFKKVEDWKGILAEARAEASRILEEAESIDKAEDAGHGQNRRGDELPAEIETTQKRIAKIEALIKKAEELNKDETSRMSTTDPEASFMHTRNLSGWPARYLRGYRRDGWDGGSFSGVWVPPNLVAAFCVAIKNESGISEFPYNLFVLESSKWTHQEMPTAISMSISFDGFLMPTGRGSPCSS